MAAEAPQSVKPLTAGAAYVQSGKGLPLPLQAGNFIKGKHYKIACFYSGLSGNSYESVLELNGDEIEKFGFSRRGSA